MARSPILVVALRINLLVWLFFVSGCTTTVPEYSPSSFRENVTRLVDQKRYKAAIKYLNSVDPVRQCGFDKAGYMAIAEDLIFLPGIEETVYYDKNRDWCIPHTSDAIYHPGWQKAAKAFAERYNQARHAEKID